MRKIFINRLVLLPLIALLFSTCKKPEEYPDEPIISFKDIYSYRDAQGYDNSLFVVLNFTDGDGDIGYGEVGENGAIYDDPLSPYYNNFQVRTFKFVNGTLVQDTFDLSARMENITPDVNNKSLKGEILRELPLPPTLDNDTYRFEIFIYDRSLHASNIITTPDVVLRTQ